MIEGRSFTNDYLSDMMNANFPLFGFPQAFNRLKIPFQTFFMHDHKFIGYLYSKQRHPKSVGRTNVISKTTERTEGSKT